MLSRLRLAQHLLDQSFKVLSDNIATLRLQEALFIPPGGYRSILGLLKHTAGWSHVYHSYAFEPQPSHWRETDWPRGLRDTINPTQDYLDEVIAWLRLSHEEWMASLRATPADAIEELRPVHWRAKAPLFEIVVLIANHHTYHAGEINYLLSMARGEAWEEGEEVEENHISTLGHRVRPPWLTSD
jgi:uncharacterized damage-inducible protein DinB